MDLAPPPESWPSTRRRRSLIASVVSLALETGILLAGLSSVHLFTCGGHRPIFWPMLAIALAALVLGVAGTTIGLRSMRDPGGVARTLAPLMGMVASILGVLVLHDVLTAPILNCIK
jgi:hypothetical protein